MAARAGLRRQVLVADILAAGVIAFGGGAMLAGFPARLQAELGFEVRVAERPLTCVAEGAAACLAHPVQGVQGQRRQGRPGQRQGADRAYRHPAREESRAQHHEQEARGAEVGLDQGQADRRQRQQRGRANAGPADPAHAEGIGQGQQQAQLGGSEGCSTRLPMASQRCAPYAREPPASTATSMTTAST